MFACHEVFRTDGHHERAYLEVESGRHQSDRVAPRQICLGRVSRGHFQAHQGEDAKGGQVKSRPVNPLPCADPRPAVAGLELRDYFAARVLGQCQVIVDGGKDAPDDEDIHATAQRFARAAYIIADAMMAERAK